MNPSLEQIVRLSRLHGGMVLVDVNIAAFMRAFFPGVPEGRRGVPGVDVMGLPGLDVLFAVAERARASEFRVLKKQAEWLSGRLAVKQAAAELLAVDPRGVVVDTEPEGSPFLADHKAYPISISHSGDHAVAVMSTRKGRRVAVDVEQVEAGRMPHVSRVAFTPREISELHGASDTEWYRRWTLKEAYLKYIAKGFHESLKKVEILDRGICHNSEEVDGIAWDTPEFHPGYQLSVVWEVA
ncbi:4'-phosphopantetheinyl transferase superfamily protein [Desulfoluna sp.]|uniref:4'-phosphopantetheinyl transferase family protein n=1 Tax=Desulfoluna sp. TaxID=2045199 RepID=UPI002609023B|nr:4'-phosphopantetheinyl transferase superfamily protein [Desulfoluna sp.]